MRLRLAMLAVVLSLAPGVAGADPPRFVVVPRDTPLYAAPRDDAANASDPDVGDTKLSEDDFWVLRKVRDRADGWIEVATAAVTTTRHAGVPQCYGAPDTGGVELHLFVRAARITEVTTQPVSVSFADGTSVRLPSGVAVGPAGADGARLVSVDGLRFTIPIPADHVGASYTAEHLALLPNQRGDEYALGGSAFLDGGKRPIAVEHPIGRFYIHRRTGQLVDINLSCSAFTATLVEAARPTPADDVSDAELDLGPVVAQVRRGAVAYWSDGSVAGRVLQDTWREIDWTSPDREHRCFAIPFRGASFGGGLLECFRTTDLRDVTRTARPHGRVTIDPGKLTTSGPQQPREILGLVRPQLSKLQKCYASSPAGQRSLSGTLGVRLAVNASGDPERYMMLRGFEQRLDECAIDVLSSLKFAPSAGTVTLFLTFGP